MVPSDGMRQYVPTEKQEALPEMQETFVIMGMTEKRGKLPRGIVSFHPWRYSKVACT